MTQRIADYGLIGDCTTAALVGRNGSIDWLCWPRFDSAACFAALLGSAEHGHFQIAPVAPVTESRRAYRRDTLVLETEWDTAEGGVTLIDFMPVQGSGSEIVRIVTGRHGCVKMSMELILRFDYGSAVPWVTRLPDGALRAVAGPDMAVLRTPVELHSAHLKTRAEFDVTAGQSVPFVLSYGASHLAVPRACDVQAVLKQTEEGWQQWADRCPRLDRWDAKVRRSLITLKALTYAPTGGIVAAPTTSLPEQLGGERNWDYRFCWLRDATLTLLALMNAQYLDEATAWRGWLKRAIAGAPEQLQIMYGVAGERRLSEWVANWLPGYAGSAPVRIGNAAANQVQLDVFGEIMDALHQARKAGLPEDPEAWALQRAMLDHVAQVWREPDQGMWESRAPAQHFTFSKVMAWVAVDRTIQDLESLGLHGPARRWVRLRDDIHADVCAHGYSEAQQAFVQAYGSSELDASLLLIGLTGFLPPEDERVRNTVTAIQKTLAFDGLIARYRTGASADGLPPGEGMFLACSFWLVEALVQQQKHGEAAALFEHLLSLANDLGLYAEEYDPQSQQPLGNFPQAFSHVAMINAAFALQNGLVTRAQRRTQAAPASTEAPTESSAAAVK